jgi:hypothetical protein
MAIQTPTMTITTTTAFPSVEVEHRLRVELQKIANDASTLRPEWEPMLDSKRVVGTILVIEDLFSGIKIRPDRVVRKGGYNGVDEALDDMLPRIEREVKDRSKPKVRK